MSPTPSNRSINAGQEMLRWRAGTAEERPADGRSETRRRRGARRPLRAISRAPHCAVRRWPACPAATSTVADGVARRRGALRIGAWSRARSTARCTRHAMQALEWEFGAASHPDVDSRTVPVLQWISSAAADEVIATLNVFCALNGEMLVAEPVRRRFNPVSHTRVWEKQWKTLSPTSVTIRVSISSDEDRPTEIHITVNGHDVNVVPPPFNRALERAHRGGHALARPGGAVAHQRRRRALDDAGGGDQGPGLHPGRWWHR